MVGPAIWDQIGTSRDQGPGFSRGRSGAAGLVSGRRRSRVAPAETPRVRTLSAAGYHEVMRDYLLEEGEEARLATPKELPGECAGVLGVLKAMAMSADLAQGEVVTASTR